MGLFTYVIEAFKRSFEERCLMLLVSAYNTSINTHDYALDWLEDDFNAMLDRLINQNPLRLKWNIHCHVEHHLHKNIMQNVRGYADREDRIDMKLSNISHRLEYNFYVEAKRLKEKDSGLLNRYIDTGIDNFLTGKYPQGILLGYLLEGVINNTVQKVNGILVKNNRASEILVRKPHNIHDQYFESTHYDFGVISHFVFDFTV